MYRCFRPVLDPHCHEAGVGVARGGAGFTKSPGFLHHVLGPFQRVCCGPHWSVGGGLVTGRRVGSRPALPGPSVTAGFLPGPRRKRSEHGHPSEAQTEKPDFFTKFASHHESPSLFMPLNGSAFTAECLCRVTFA